MCSVSVQSVRYTRNIFSVYCLDLTSVPSTHIFQSIVRVCERMVQLELQTQSRKGKKNEPGSFPPDHSVLLPDSFEQMYFMP